MKRTILSLIAFASVPVLAQDQPQSQPKKWDISQVDVSKLPPVASDTGVTFDKDIEPILKASCLGCHGEQRPRGNLRLDSLENVLKGGKDGQMVVPGDSSKSLLVAAAARIDDKIAMPPKFRGRRPGGPGGPGGEGGPGGPPPGSPPPGGGPSANDGGPGGGPPPGAPGGPGRRPPPKPLTLEQVGLIRAWIDQGAK